MNEKTATILSFLFHPLILPCATLAVMMGMDPVVSALLTPGLKLMILGMVFITTILVPLLVIFLLYRFGLIGSFYMKEREERGIPLLMVAGSYYLTYYLLKGLHLPQIFHLFMLGATGMIILLILFHFYRKVSLHMAGMGAFTGLIAGMALQNPFHAFWFISAGLFLSGLIGTARLKLNAHQPSDICIGWLTGAAVMFCTGFFL